MKNAPIETIRRRLGMSQAELAHQLGRSQAQVSNYENGVDLPPEVARLLVGLARSRLLELTMDHVYGLEPLPEPPAPEVAPTPKAA